MWDEESGSKLGRSLGGWYGFQVTRGVGEFGIGWSGARVRTKEETGEGVGKQVDFLF